MEMEFGSKALYRGAAVLILLLGGAGMWGQSSSEGRVFQLEARHTRLWTDRPGTLTFDAVGIRFEQSSAGEKEEPFAASWPYEDLQELALSPEEVRLVTYEDRPWLLGRDRRFTFALSPGQDIKPLYGMLKRRMDRRFVAGIADPEAGTLWEVPVKRSGLFKGAQGVLRIGRDMIVFEANRPGESRSWRYQDI